MEAAGLDTSESAAKIKQWQDEQRQFLKQTGLKRQGAREQIAGAGKSDFDKAKRVKAAQELALLRREAYNNAIYKAKTAIKSDEFPKKINAGNQSKHILGSKGYTKGRSYIYGDLETAQVLVNRYSGTGTPRLDRKNNWTHKEYVALDSSVGVAINPEAGTEIETRAFLIHYGKKGTHIVPTKEAVEK